MSLDSIGAGQIVSLEELINLLSGVTYFGEGTWKNLHLDVVSEKQLAL